MLQLLSALHDPMTQQEYVKPLDTFTLKVEPEDWVEVDVLGSGKMALQEVNKKMGVIKILNSDLLEGGNTCSELQFDHIQ